MPLFSSTPFSHLLLVLFFTLSHFSLPVRAAVEIDEVVEWGRPLPYGTSLPRNLHGVVQAAVGFDFTAALKADGTVVAWGQNTDSALVVPGGLGGVVAIAGKSAHVLALKNDGTVVAWGRNNAGQCNVPAQLSGVKAIDATFYYSLALKNDGTVVAWGDASNAVTQVPAALTGVTAIAAGGFHALALKADGTVVAWGALNLSADSPTRIPAGLRDVVAVAAEFDYSLALKKDGTVVAWGNNGSGQTNVPPGLSQVTAIAAASGHAIALKSDGTVVGWGGEGTFRPYGEQIPPQGLTQVKAISAGGQRSLAIGFPMIGLPQFETFRYGFYHVYSISLEELTATSATLHATINPHSTDTAVRFQIGIAPNYDTTIDAIPLTVTGNLPIQVTAKVTGLLPDKNYTFRAVASNAVGGSTVTSSFTTLKIVPTAVDDLAVTTGKPMTIMPLANDLDPSNTGLAIAGFTQGSHGSVSFGNTASELLYTPDVNSSDLIPEDDHFTYTLLNGGTATVTVVNEGSSVADTVYTNGGTVTIDPRENDIFLGSLAIVSVTQPAHGQVTLANDLITYTPAPDATGTETFIYTLADGSSAYVSIRNEAAPPFPKVVEWGNPYPVGATPAPSLHDVVQVAEAANFAIALRKNGTVVSWGLYAPDEAREPARLNKVVAIAAGSNHALALRKDGSVVGWGRRASNAVTVPIGLAEVKAIAAGFDASLALKKDGTVVAWGAGSKVPGDLNDVTAIAVGDTFHLALRNDGTVVSWAHSLEETGGGIISGFALPPPDGLSGVTAIAAGSGHALALKSDGTVVAWGAGKVPQALSGVSAIAAAPHQAFALKEDGTVVSWLVGDGSLLDLGTLPPPLQNVAFIAAGPQRSAAIGMPIPGMPSIIGSVSATAITENSVTLTARIAPNSAETSVHFQFEYDVLGGNPVQLAPAIVHGNLPVIVTRSAVGLTPGKSYSYSLVVSNALGRDLSYGNSFKTLRTPVAVADFIDMRSQPFRFDPRMNDLDPDATGLDIVAFSQGAHGKVAFTPVDNTLTYTPALASPGDDQFTYTLRGGSQATVTLRNLSSAVPDVIYNNGQPVTFAPMANDKPSPDNSVVLQSVTQGLHGKVTFSGNLLTYTPTVVVSAADQFTYTLSDQSIGLVSVIPAPVVYQFGLAKAQSVPGEPTGTVYTGFDVPAVGAFSGMFREGDQAPLKAIFSTNGAIQLKAGGTAPGIDGAQIARLGVPNGQAALVTLRPRRGAITAANSTLLYTGLDTGNPKAAVRTGTALPGLDGVRFRSIVAFDGNGPAVFFLATLAGNQVNHSNDVALCAVRDGGQVKVLARKGMSYGGKLLTVLSTLTGAPGSLAEGRWRIDGHTIGMRATFSDKSHAVLSIPDTAQNAGDWTLRLSTPLIRLFDPGLMVSMQASAIGLPEFGPHGVSSIVTASPTKETAFPFPEGISKANDQFLLHIPASGNSSIMAREGRTVPGLDGKPLNGLTYKTFFDPVEGANGRGAFLATFNGTGVKTSNNTGLFAVTPTRVIRMIARAGDAAPGGGFWGRFISLVLPNRANIDALFTATLSGPAEAPARNLGLWVAMQGRAPELLCRSGDQLLLGNAMKTIRSIVALAPVAGSIGAAGGYDEDGHLSVLATFEDGSQGFIHIRLPLVP